jgi:hypothetical protein
MQILDFSKHATPTHLMLPEGGGGGHQIRPNQQSY